jgi:hypothetical protein
MHPLIEESIRLKISNILERLSEIPNKQKITIKDIDILLEHVSQKSSKAVSLMTEKANKELSIAHFGSLVIGLTALKLADAENPRPINAKWLQPEKTIDPNIVLESLLVNITNQCFSIISLASLGYAWPARIILRSTLEITWLTLVLISEREKMSLYSETLSDKNEQELFHKHFSGSKLKKALTAIEQKLQFSEDVIMLYSNARSEAYTLFTKHVHNSYAATILGARAPSLDNPDILEYALFNTPSVPAISVINSLNQQVLFYLIGILLPALKVFHSFNSAALWDDIVTLRECFVRLYVFQNT